MSKKKTEKKIDLGLSLTEDEIENGDKYFEDIFQKKIVHDGSFSITSVLKKIIKQILKGKEFFRISVPIEFINPQSALEFFSLMFTPTGEFLSVNNLKDPVEKMKVITTWFLQNNSQNYFNGFFHVKPYNPVLGEVFSSYWKYSDEKLCSFSFLLCEQISHHPPKSAFRFVNKSAKVFIDSNIQPDSKIYLNSGALYTTGFFRIKLGDDEIYEIDFPKNLASGVFYGSNSIAPYGDCTIECKKTGVKTQLKFHSKGVVNGKIISGDNTVGKISGNGLKEIFFEDKKTSKKSLLIDVEVAMEKKLKQFVKDIKDQEPNESRRKWLKCTKHVLKKNFSKAQEVKNYIEAKERKKRKESKEEWEPQYFKKAENGEYVCTLDDEKMILICK